MGGWYTEAEAEALAQVLRSMSAWTRTYTREHQERFEAAFAARVGARHAITVNSGGAALDLVMTALGAQDGDEVISCALNFPGTHLAVLGKRLHLVLAEPDAQTLNLDPEEILRRMTRRTAAILVTHMNGLPADLDTIVDATAARSDELGIRPPPVVVDAARACGAATPAGPVGSGGQAWVTMFSFHRKKHMTTLGEGGMLTTDDDQAATQVRRLRSFGHGQQWGSSHRMTEYQAAVGLVQLRRLEEMLAPRIELARARTARLDRTPGLLLPSEPAGYRHVYYLYNLILDSNLSRGTRDLFRSALDAHHVGSLIANVPTYKTNPFIAHHTSDQTPLPVAENVANRLLCLAIHPLMSRAENERIADVVTETLDQLNVT